MQRRALRVGIAVLAAWPALVAAQATPTLMELYRRALDTHPALQAQRSAVDRAEARRDQAASRLRLQASISLGTAYNDFRGQDAPPSEYGSQRHSLSLRQPLFDRAATRTVQAEAARIEQSRDELEAARIDLAAELIEQMLDVLNADEELGVVQAEKEAVASQRARLRRMVELQLAKVPALLEVEAYAATLDVREIEARNALQIALEKLRQTSGVRDLAALRRVRPDLPGAAPGSVDDWLQRGQGGSPRLAAARRAIEAEQRSIDSVRAQSLPQVALTGSKTWANNDADNRRNPPFNVASVGLQLNWPLYEGGRVDGALREAVAREAVARAQLDEHGRDMELQVRTAWLKMRSDRQRIDATQLQMQAQEKARDAQQRGFELNAVTIVDLLEAQRRLFRARADLARARHDYVRSVAALRRHSGALGEAELENLSAWFTEEPARPAAPLAAVAACGQAGSATPPACGNGTR